MLSISDNGIGLKPAIDDPESNTKGLGLMGMKERALLTDGMIKFESPQSGGLQVLGEWKIH